MNRSWMLAPVKKKVIAITESTVPTDERLFMTERKFPLVADSTLSAIKAYQFTVMSDENTEIRGRAL